MECKVPLGDERPGTDILLKRQTLLVIFRVFTSAEQPGVVGIACFTSAWFLVAFMGISIANHGAFRCFYECTCQEP